MIKVDSSVISYIVLFPAIFSNNCLVCGITERRYAPICTKYTVLSSIIVSAGRTSSGRTSATPSAISGSTLA